MDTSHTIPFVCIHWVGNETGIIPLKDKFMQIFGRLS